MSAWSGFVLHIYFSSPAGSSSQTLDTHELGTKLVAAAVLYAPGLAAPKPQGAVVCCVFKLHCQTQESAAVWRATNRRVGVGVMVPGEQQGGLSLQKC